MDEAVEWAGRRIGIRGGPGSFNDSALKRYLEARGIFEVRLRYLGTTPAVLTALSAGEIDLGQFAIYNTVGGLYEETLSVIGDHLFRIVDRHSMPIEHALMIRRDADPGEVETILTHPEVLKQCRMNLARHYPGLRQQHGEGHLADPAGVAEALAAGRLPGTVAAMSNPRLADLHGLRILRSGLQDRRDSESTFLLVAPADSAD